MACPERQAKRERLADEITRAAGHLNALTYTFIKMLDEFDRVEGWAGDGIKSFAHWLNWKCGLGAVEAREKVRVARALRELPQIDDAFRTGEISYTKVRAMTRVATPDNQSWLMTIARHGTAAHVERLVKRYRRCRVLNEDDPLGHLDRYFSGGQADDGMYDFRGKLPADEGELVIRALHKIMDQQWLDRQQERERTKECGSEAKNVSAETTDALQYDASMATAITRMAEHCLATALDREDGELQALSGAGRHQLVVLVNVNDAHRDCQVEQGAALNTPDGQFMHPEVVRKLACDAMLRPVGMDEDGNVMSIGRKSRTIPPHIRFALEQRDGGCRFPSCTETKHVDGHHIKHWADGGETSLDNLVSLCRFHHSRLHLGHYSLELNDGKLFFLDSGGRLIERVILAKPQDPSTILDELDQARRGEGIIIDASTAVTRWEGERMDYSMAIEALAYWDSAKPEEPG